MAHKLAHRWRVFTMDDGSNPPRFVQRGVMDLRRMAANGTLTDGEYEESVNNEQFKITGAATELGNLLRLELQNPERPGESWRGFLIFEQGEKLKVGGTRVLPTNILADQNEEPWLITKP